MNNNQNHGINNMVSENKGRGVFYGVIAIATFIIMAVGATFAYFTATTQSMDAAVQTGSTTLELQYISYGEAWMKDDLIPADTMVVEYSIEGQSDATINEERSPAGEDGVYPVAGNNTLCKDDYGNSICSVYVFQVRNTALSYQDLSINVVSEINTFGNLYAMAYEMSVPTDEDELSKYNTVYDPTDETLKTEKNGRNDPNFRENEEDSNATINVTDGAGKLIYDYTPVYVNRDGTVKKLLSFTDEQETGETTTTPAIDKKIALIADPSSLGTLAERTAKIANKIRIEGGETKTFALVLYILNNPNEDQTKADADKVFEGQVTVSSGESGEGVSGQIGAVSSPDFDSSKLQSNQNNTSQEPETGGEETDDSGTNP